MTIDDLDARLLSTFAAYHPRPSTVPYCDYDVDRAEMIELCTGAHVHENPSLITSFVSHNRWGMFGDWTHFPAFAGDVAVFARRRGFDHEHDLAFFYLHTSACGRFDEALFPLLAEWAADILMPWNRMVERDELFGWEIHAIGYLGIYCNVGGAPEYAIQQNIAQSRLAETPTRLLEVICDHVLPDPDRIYQHFSSARRSADNQELTARDCRWVPVKHVKRIHAAIDAARLEIEEVCARR